MLHSVILSAEPVAVLLAEDHVDTRESYEIYLRSCGFDVSVAEDGREALDEIQSHMPDALVLDLGLPRMDGWEAMRQVRASQACADLPIIAVTAHAMPKERQRTEELGCDAFLTKPCPPTEIVGSLRSVLSARWRARIAAKAVKEEVSRQSVLLSESNRLLAQLRASREEMRSNGRKISATLAALKVLAR